MIFNGAISRDGRTMLITRGVVARDAFRMTKFRQARYPVARQG